MSNLRTAALLTAAVVVATACQDGSFTAPETRISADVTSQQARECRSIDFEDFDHGDEITGVSLNFTAGTFTASVDQIRYESSGVFPGEDAVAYSSSFYSTGTLPNNTHLDTQYDDGDLPTALCGECAPSGFGVEVMAMVQDVDFAEDGDNTEGGQIIFTITGGGDLGDYEITEFLSVDDDENELGRRLFVDGTLVATAPGDGPNGDVELVSASANSWTSTAIFEFGRKNGQLGWTAGDVNGSGGIDQIEVCLTTQVNGGGEGCTPGFWKNNTGAWPSTIDPDDDFCSWFDCPASFDLARPESGTLQDLTLLEALDLRGGGVNALARHAVAALLNAESSVDFDLTVGEVQTAVNDALDDPSTIEDVKDDLEELNEQGCPLAADEAAE